MCPALAGQMVERRPCRRVDGDDVGEAVGQLGVVLEGVPAGEGEAPDSVSQNSGSVWRVGAHGQYRLLCAHEVREEPGDALASYVSCRPHGPRMDRRPPPGG